MKKVDLRKYPKFWADFIGRVEEAYGTSYAVNVTTLKGLIEEWYGIRVHITSTAERGEVYMLEKTIPDSCYKGLRLTCKESSAIIAV